MINNIIPTVKSQKASGNNSGRFKGYIPPKPISIWEKSDIKIKLSNTARKRRKLKKIDLRRIDDE